MAPSQMEWEWTVYRSIAREGLLGAVRWSNATQQSHVGDKLQKSHKHGGDIKVSCIITLMSCDARGVEECY